MGSGAQRVATGVIRGTGADLDIHKVGFRPGTVEVWNVAAGGLVKGYWQDTMPDDSMFKTAIDGTNTFPTSNGITPLADGFSLGADTDMNVSGETVHYRCTD